MATRSREARGEEDKEVLPTDLSSNKHVFRIFTRKLLFRDVEARSYINGAGIVKNEIAAFNRRTESVQEISSS